MVGRDICNMIDYDPDTSWAHITCDGTVANLESMWAAREVKFLPPGIKDALQKEKDFADAKDIKVKLPVGTSKELTGLDTWQLLNLTCDDVLAVPALHGPGVFLCATQHLKSGVQGEPPPQYC